MNEGPMNGQAARSPQDILGGLALVAIAALALWLVRDLPATGRGGFASGPAPRLFAYGLGGLGLFIAIQGFFKPGPKLERFPLRGMVTILGSVVLFGLSIRVFGLVVTGVPMVLLAASAASDNRWLQTAAFAAGITGFCAVLFPVVLGQPIPLWPTF